MLLVGLTGGIASGKSTVDRIFRESGIPVICADELAREAVQQGSPALEEIRRLFGDEFVDQSGNLDRVAMAKLVFQDPGKRKVLESIIHPFVAERRRTLTEEFGRQGHPFVVVDVPLMYESNWHGDFDKIIVVYVPEAVQEQRLIERDGMTQAQARSRLDAQMNIEVKKERADLLIDNTGSLEHTREQVLKIIKQLQILARSRET